MREREFKPFKFGSSGDKCTAISGNDLKRLETEEYKLARELRSHCDLYGREKKEQLKHSAVILAKLGEVYLQKSAVLTGMEQKLSFIRCAVLLHGAIARFKIVGDVKKVEETKVTSRELGRCLLKASGSISERHVTDISEGIFEIVSDLRASQGSVVKEELNIPDHKTFKNLKKLEMLVENENLSVRDVERAFSHEKEEQRETIGKVKAVNEMVTRFYKTIMQITTEQCLDLLPPPPCEFAIVGLGSLAREEITLYSDFEHVILLEDGIDQKECYESVLEYFRWFSVVFQIIIIGFGETIIPSVPVISLNDAYSRDQTKKWFYDNFTPKGISFDGMVPNACNIPLGRQQKTKNRRHVVELIKTPDKMAKYMTHQQHLKNGYYLADILGLTCLVYGNQQIYNSFLECRAQVCKDNGVELQKHYREAIVENPNPYVRRSHFVTTILNTIDSKQVFYRPLQTCICYHARLHEIEPRATFSLIKELENRGLLNPTLSHELSYAFAIACAIRTKSSHLTNQQRQASTIQDLYKLVGVDAIISCKHMMGYCYEVVPLRTDGQIRLLNYSFMSDMVGVRRWISNLANHGYYQEAITIGEKLLSRNSLEFDCGKEMMVTYFLAGVKKEHLRSEYFPKAEYLYSRLIRKNPAGVTPRWKFEMCFWMAQLYRMEDKNIESIDVLEKLFDELHKAKAAAAAFGSFTYALSSYIHAILVSRFSAEEKDQKLNTLWDKFPDKLECKLFKRLQFAISDNGSDYSQCELKWLTTDVRLHVAKLDKPSTLLTLIAKYQIFMWCLEDAVETLELIQQISSRSNKADILDSELLNPDALKFLCLCQLRRQRKQNRSDVDGARQYLLRNLVSLLWRGTFLFSLADREPSIVVLLWVIDLIFIKRYQPQDIFSAESRSDDTSTRRWKVEMASKAVTEFANGRKHGEGTAGAEYAYATLLLEKSLSGFDFRSHLHQIKSLHSPNEPDPSEITKKLFRRWCNSQKSRTKQLDEFNDSPDCKPKRSHLVASDLDKENHATFVAVNKSAEEDKLHRTFRVVNTESSFAATLLEKELGDVHKLREIISTWYQLWSRSSTTRFENLENAFEINADMVKLPGLLRSGRYLIKNRQWQDLLNKSACLLWRRIHQPHRGAILVDTDLLLEVTFQKCQYSTKLH